jgi:hypothetical protein
VSCFCLDRAGHVQHPESTELKVLIISGYPADGFPAQILHKGCEGFLQKPDPSTIQPFDIVPGLQPVPFRHSGLKTIARALKPYSARRGFPAREEPDRIARRNP